jgi:hypothetical protein
VKKYWVHSRKEKQISQKRVCNVRYTGEAAGKNEIRENKKKTRKKRKKVNKGKKGT